MGSVRPGVNDTNEAMMEFEELGLRWPPLDCLHDLLHLIDTQMDCKYCSQYRYVGDFAIICVALINE